MQELLWAIQTLIRDKAPGPDGLPVGCCNGMNIEQLQLVLNVINGWWIGSEIPMPVTQAKVTARHKKQDNNKRMNAPQKFIQMMTELCRQLAFKVEMDGQDST